MQNQVSKSPYDLAAVAKIASRYKSEPDQLMHIMLDVQKICDNHIPKEAAVVISEVTGISESDIYSYVTFYAAFSTVPRGKYVIRMCKSAPCHIVGAKAVAEAIGDFLGIKPGETTPDGLFTLEFCQCIGRCDTAPAIMVNEDVYSGLTPKSAVDIIKKYKEGGAV